MEVTGPPDDDAALERPVLTLPPDFEAFYTLHYLRYLGYATIHLGPDRGTEAVRNVFGELATDWMYVLSRPDPTAHAWRVFTEHTRIHSARPDSRAPCPVARLLGQLPHIQHDAVVLHYLLNQSMADSALTMGIDPGRMPSLLREALRR